METQAISQSLEALSGFKALFAGLFGGGKAKKSFDVYSAADKRGVYQLYKLRYAEHNESQYAVYAFCPWGDIAPDALDVITDRVGQVDLGVLRYECLSYSCLEKWRGQDGSNANRTTVITGIAPEYPGVFIFPVAYKADCTYVIYAHRWGEDYIFPITDKQAAKIGG